MKNLLLDTDVIMDFLGKREPFYKSASSILAKCESGIVKGYLTPVIISNINYLNRKFATREATIEKMGMLLTFLGILDMNRSIVIQALLSDFKDFEDALQHFSAIANGEIDCIVTRNKKDFKTSSIAVFEPSEFLRIIKN
ncbi:MAG: PIN domain-containing protein [Cyclobacteriaceae bacterium]